MIERIIFKGDFVGLLVCDVCCEVAEELSWP